MKRALGMAAALMLCGAAEAKGDLIINGGFEQPTVASGSYTTFYANNGNSTFSGWTVTNNSVDVVNNFVLSAYQGSNWLDLDGSGSSGHYDGTIQQTFATTAGTTYTLSFAYSNNPVGTGGESAAANVTVVGANSSTLLSAGITHNSAIAANPPNYYGSDSQPNWTLFSETFTANGASATLQFASTDPDGSNNGIALDAVSVNPVPAPGGFVLIGSALAACAGYFAWKRRLPPVGPVFNRPGIKGRLQTGPTRLPPPVTPSSDAARRSAPLPRR